MPEIADFLGVSRQRVHQMAERDPCFPEPATVLAVGKIWRGEDIRAWAAKYRPPLVDEE
ncbi:hypothetical protein [Micromonospora zhanjiangensis]|uniref:DNA-binding protein n=2 Tax=Micromonospora zhanjiangensis TaxID=1522057 RepID=A0ABV8KUS7_9ACTN